MVASSKVATTKRSFAPLLVSLTAVAAAGLLLVFAWFSHPVPGSDSLAYVPPAIHYAAGDGLVNPAWYRGVWIDPAHVGRFLYYPPLFQLMVGSLVWTPTVQAAFFVIGWIKAACVLLAAALLFALATKSAGPLTALQGVLVSLAVVGVAASTAGNAGRPEPLVMLLLLAGAACVMVLPAKRLWFPLGIVLGLIGATHPVGGVLGAILIALVLATSRRFGPFIVDLVKTAAVSIAVFSAVVWFSGLDPVALLTGIRAHARLAVVREERHGFVRCWLLNTDYSFYGLLVALAAYAGGLIGWRNRGRIAAPNIFVALVVLLAGAVWYFCRRHSTSYNLEMFAPLMYGLVLFWALCRDEPAITTRPLRIGTTFVVFGLTVAALARHTVLFAFLFNGGMTLAEAQLAVRPYLEGNEPIGFTGTMWAMTPDRARCFQWQHRDHYPDHTRAIVICQQRYFASTTAPQIASHTLVIDAFSPVKPRLFGLPIANTMPGYRFALYLPKPDAKPDPTYRSNP